MGSGPGSLTKRGRRVGWDDSADYGARRLEPVFSSFGQTQASEGPMTARILIGIYLLFASVIIAFETITGAAAAPPTAQMQYPGDAAIAGSGNAQSSMERTPNAGITA
jgi:hypothetical protein